MLHCLSVTFLFYGTISTSIQALSTTLTHKSEIMKGSQSIQIMYSSMKALNNSKVFYEAVSRYFPIIIVSAVECPLIVEPRK